METSDSQSFLEILNLLRSDKYPDSHLSSEDKIGCVLFSPPRYDEDQLRYLGSCLRMASESAEIVFGFSDFRLEFFKRLVHGLKYGRIDPRMSQSSSVGSVFAFEGEVLFQVLTDLLNASGLSEVWSDDIDEGDFETLDPYPFCHRELVRSPEGHYSPASLRELESQSVLDDELSAFEKAIDREMAVAVTQLIEDQRVSSSSPVQNFLFVCELLPTIEGASQDTVSLWSKYQRVFSAFVFENFPDIANPDPFSLLWERFARPEFLPEDPPTAHVVGEMSMEVREPYVPYTWWNNPNTPRQKHMREEQNLPRAWKRAMRIWDNQQNKKLLTRKHFLEDPKINEILEEMIRDAREKGINTAQMPCKLPGPLFIHEQTREKMYLSDDTRSDRRE